MKRILIVLLLASVALGFGSHYYMPTFLSLGTVSTTTTRVTYTGNGSSTAFTFSFPIVETSDIVVLLRNISTGAEETLVESTNYSVTRTGNTWASGGTVTTVSTYASTHQIIIMRDTPDTQATDLDDSGVLRLADLEAALDRATLQIQQLQEESDRCIKVPRSDATTITTELTSSVGASRYLQFDADGDVDVSGSVISDTVTVSALWDTVLALTTSDASLTALDFTQLALDLRDDATSLDFGATLTADAGEWVLTAAIADANVTLAKMADESIDSDQYVDGSIDNAHLAADSVDSDNYVDGSIDTAHIADANITTAKLADDAVTADKLATGVAWQTDGTTVYGAAAAPTSFTDLDLSAQTGAVDAMVLLKVLNASGVETYYFRENGETANVGENGANPWGTSACRNGTNMIAYVWVPTDGSGVVEWKCTNTATTTITLVGFMQ